MLSQNPLPPLLMIWRHFWTIVTHGVCICRRKLRELGHFRKWLGYFRSPAMAWKCLIPGIACNTFIKCRQPIFNVILFVWATHKLSLKITNHVVNTCRSYVSHHSEAFVDINDEKKTFTNFSNSVVFSCEGNHRLDNFHEYSKLLPSRNFIHV